MHCSKLAATDLRRTLARMSTSSSCGADGWRVAELKMLPDVFLDRLCTVLDAIEETGVWPDDLAQGIVSLISKGEGAQPLKLRPISVMPVVYRLWAATRVREIMQWQDSWLSDRLHGFRRSHGPQHVWWSLAAKVEKALLLGEPLSGISLDYSKCFDRVPVDIVFSLAEHCGFDGGVLRAMRAMYKQLRRRFSLHGSVGEEFRATNGILQGCPLSVVLLNLLVHTWAKALETEAPGVDPFGFADDTGATASDSSLLEPAVATTAEFAKLTGQQLNAEKSKLWSTDAASEASGLPALCIDGGSFGVVRDLKCLGAHVRFRRGLSNPTMQQRIQNGIVCAGRIAWCQLPFHLRIEMVASLVVQSSLYGVESGGPVAVALHRLQSACLKAVWGLNRQLRARELVFTLLAPGHRVDPKQAAAYQCLRTFRCMAASSAELRALLLNVWSSCSACPQAKDSGPVGCLSKVLSLIGWTWHQFDEFARPGRAPLPLLGGSLGWWLHEVRDGLRCAQWKMVASRRQDCAGMDALAGVDRLATLKLLNSKTLPAQDKGCLRSVLSGSLRTFERLHQAGLKDSPLCPFCNRASETLQHLWWHCPAWQHQRFDARLPCEAVRRDMPPCTQSLGVYMEDSDVLAFQQIVPTGGFAPLPEELRAPGSESLSGARVVVWTDGACRNNQQSRFRRAGAGAFYAVGSCLNFAFALDGRDQTNNRAELLAVVMVLRRDQRDLEIRTDSEWVLNGFQSWTSWKDAGWSGEHPDLWSELSALLSSRAVSSAAMVKVVGHASQTQVNRGHVLAEDKLGNDEADALATLAADSHAAPSALVQAAALRSAHAEATHKMMLRIISARRCMEASLGVDLLVESDGEDAGASDADPG